MENKRILITGGAGYIGSHTALVALESGYDVAIVDDLSTGVRTNVPSNCKFYHENVSNSDKINLIFQDFNPKSVIHFAGSIVVPESLEDPVKYYKNNTSASLFLIENCLKHHVKYFVFSSTAAVYGVPETKKINESTPTHPINPYGQSKLMIERILADISAASDLTYAALRYFNVAGADTLLRTGQSNPEATHLIKVACQAAVGIRDSLKIFGTDYDTPDGTCIRDYIHVSDLARAHLTVLEHMTHNEQNLILNCGNGKGYSVSEVLEAVQRVSGTALNIQEAARRPGDPPVLIADPGAIQSLIGWKARHTDLDEIVSTALKWEQKQVSL